jgi:DNA-binding response OmpR family regulator
MVILLVDDDVGVLSSLLVLLKADGFTVLTAYDGESALEASRSHPGPIDLLLSDMEMPGMNGLELCRKMRAERPGIKVLVMSGDLRWREPVCLDGLRFLQKPFIFTALRDAMKGLLRPFPFHAVT